MMKNSLESVWMNGLTSKPKKNEEGDAKPSRVKLPKYPKKLQDDVVNAIANLERWLAYEGVNENVLTAFNDYRNNVYMGVLNPFFVSKYSEDTGLIEAFYRLEKAHYAMLDYHPGVADLTQGLAKAFAAHIRGDVSQERKNAMQMLIQYKYLEAPRGNEKTEGTKGWIRAKVQASIGACVSDGTFDSIVRELKKQNT